MTGVPAPRVVDEPDGAAGFELWPSLGEYPVYDSFVYHVMTNDEVRNAPYRRALEGCAPGRVVVDVGTGQDLLWARAAVDAGARRVFAIESLPDAAARAAELAGRLGLDGVVEVVAGFARDVELPEPADVCVVEMVGSIGSAEGVDRVAHDARRRLVAPGGVVLPGRIVTRVCGITLPDAAAEDPGFTLVAADYVEQVWDAVGEPFDVRLAVRGIEAHHVVTGSAVVEVLDLAGGEVAGPGAIDVALPVERPGRLHGLLLWTSVAPLPGGPTIETFPTTGSGLPVYVPLFPGGLALAPGDDVEVTFDRRPGADGFHPDYRIGVGPVAIDLPHAGGVLGQNAFYEALWSG